MEVLTQITNLSNRYSGIAVALGTFDGVHIGHQQIIKRAIELAKKSGGTSAVFTFSNHPLSIIAPERCPLQVITPEYKIEVIRELGIDVLLNIPFTPELLTLPPTAFLDLLQENLNPSYIIVGPNYSFGYKSAGTPKVLKSAEQQYGFKVEVHPAVYLDDKLVSSTAIRQKIMEGDVSGAARLLGRKLRIEGEVTTGQKRGRKLGFPTANLVTDPGLAIPADGVYAVYAHVEGITYRGVANIGNNPTFPDLERHVEVHLLDFTGDIYSKTLIVDFVHRIRGEIAFHNADELKEQIQADIRSLESMASFDN